MGRTDGFAAAGSRFGDFTVVELLHQSERSLVLRCARGAEAQVVKLLRAEFVQAGDVARLRREYELSRRIAHPHVVSASQLGSHAGVLFLAMPDDHALALRELLLRQGPLTPRDALRTALGIVDALEAVHAKNVVHKDVAPGNIIADFASGTVKLIDFGIAAEISSERPELARPEDLEGTLASMAPEQSGRMNRDVDYRADFYGLGATLFEVLVGAAPFAFSDPVQAVHAHLAQAPPLLTELRPDLPAALGALVARLLAKEPEARYQSHAVLRRDLQHILEHLDNPARLDAYPLAVDDLPERFQVSGRLYGRTHEAARIVAAFEAAARGPVQLVTIGGVPGIGKTALVNEVQRSLLGHRGNFVSGKFNQSGQHAPYDGFIQALQQRARQVLALTTKEQQHWCEALMDALGANAALAAQAVPDLDRLLGPLPPVLALAPAEAENRFLRAIQSCFSALASAAQPLVLFIDDLQWADRSSRRLLRELAQDSLLRHVLIIGAYRSNEVPPDHPLVYDLAALAAGQHVATLSVEPLSEEDVRQLVADTLHRPVDDVRELAAMCHAKTGGNPFFLRRFLEDVHQRGLIWLDRGAAQWDWALVRIRAEHIADNVVELMVEQLRRLPPATVALLNTAACLGGRFELRTLAIAAGQTEEAVQQALAPALQASMLVGTDTHYKWAGVLPAAERPGLRVELAFVHDRVREAAYALTPAQERPALHLHIGRMLRGAANAGQPAYAVVNHLNLGQGLIRIAAERMQLAQLNLEASERARDAAAFDLAADYAEQAIALRGEGSWRSAHSPTLAAYVHAARMAYLGARPERMEALIAAALPHARNPLEQARLMDIRIESFYASGQLGQALDVGLAALRLLGVEPPAAATPERVARLVANIKAEIETIGIGALAARAPMTDPLCLQQISVASKMTAAAYIARPALLPLLTVLQVRLMMSRGHAPAALSAYSVMGLMAAEFLRDYRFGYDLGRMSLDLVQRHGWHQMYAHAAFSFNAFLRHWIEPVASSLPALLEVNRNGQEFGNLRHAALSLYTHGYHAFLAGEPLADLAPLLQEHAATLRRIRQPVAQDYLSVLIAVVGELRQERLALQPLEGAGFSAEQLEQTYSARGDQTGGMFVHAFRCMLHALAGRPAEAVVSGEAAASLFPAARGMLMVPFCVFFTAVSSLALAQRMPPEQRQQRRAQAEAALARFDLWVQTSGDLVPLARLLRASLAAFDGEAQAARAELDAALAAAEHLGNLFLLGLVRWRRGLALADDAAAAAAAAAELAEARTVFLRWGATALAAAVRLPSQVAATHDNGAPVAAMPASALDLATLMKAVQAVTAEIELAPLLARMLAVLQEDAGARRAAIVLKDAHDWVLQADSDNAGRVRMLENLPLEHTGERLPLEIVRTVLNTASPVLIQDLAQEPRWKRLAYFQQRGGRSVLCMPLTQQGRTVGALHLENDAIAGAFSPARMQFLEFLSGNVVNAIDNARLYEQLRGLAGSLEQRVAERTRELQESEARTMSILQNAPMPMSVTRRADGILVYANERAAAVTGFTPETLTGHKAASRYRDSADRERLYAKYRADGLLRDHEVCLLAQDGSERWTLISMVPIVYDGEPADLAAVVDITERKAIEETLRRMATTDALTGVANRGHFMQRAAAELDRARRYGRPLSVVMLDIDHFKQINDRHGHAGGDEVLRAVTAACVGLVRQQDTVGRLGGEEFGLLMPETEIEPATLLAERLRAAVAALRVTLISGETVSLGASFGVSALRAEDTVDSLLARADGALYASKNGGRNRVSVG